MTRISIICAAVGVLAALTLSAQSVSAAGVTIPTPNVPKVTVRPLPPKLNNAILQGGSQGTHVGISAPDKVEAAGQNIQRKTYPAYTTRCNGCE
jgi:hypothetical protein